MKKVLIRSSFKTLITLVAVSLLVLPNNAPLWGWNGKFVESTFMDALVPIIAILFFVPGLVYGYVTKEIKNDKDVANALAKTMGTMWTFIVLAFTARQFVAFFFESNMGLLVGVFGANFL